VSSSTTQLDNKLKWITFFKQANDSSLFIKVQLLNFGITTHPILIFNVSFFIKKVI
jgi:hypothetical protein